MEIVSGTAHTAFPLHDESGAWEARHFAVRCAQDLGFDEAAMGRVAQVVTELATNLVQHAQKGRLLISTRAQRGEVEVLSIDEGPGIPDLARSLSERCAPGGSPETGLGAVRRLAQLFDIHSSVPQGTIVLARLQRQELPAPDCSRFAVGAVSTAAPGETACGDAWIVASHEGLATFMVSDGLGHGPDAARASGEAVQAFLTNPLASPQQHLQLAHDSLGGTRGAAVSVFALDAELGTVRLAGAGNVLGRVISGVSDKSMLPQNGTVGLRIRTPHEVTSAWPPHALVLAHSDGIEGRWDSRSLLPLLMRDPAIVAAALLRDHCRGRDDAAVVVVRRKD